MDKTIKLIIMISYPLKLIWWINNRHVDLMDQYSTSEVISFPCSHFLILSIIMKLKALGKNIHSDEIKK